MTVHAQPDYHIQTALPAPKGYPSIPVFDTFSEEPFLPDYSARRQAFFNFILRNPAPENTKAAWFELGRLAAGGIPHEGIFQAALDFIAARKDCSDFVLHGILRLLLSKGQEIQGIPSIPIHLLSKSLVERAKQTVLGFKYFPDEPGIDSLCTWTENHYILFTSAAFLAGQLYSDEIFTNSGETGRQKVAKNRRRILRWLDLRFHTGFSEWLSHVYYDEDLTALLALYDFAADGEIRRKSEQIIHLLLLDLALNSFKGVFGSTHGRAYENTKKWASNEGTTDTAKLLFGMGQFSRFDNMSAIAFALSSYQVPDPIQAIARYGSQAGDSPIENRQRMGIKLAEMERWGLHPDNFEDGMLYLTLEAYLHPRTITNTLHMFDLCNWWDNAFLNSFKPYRRLLKIIRSVGGLPFLARLLIRDICRNTREEVNLYSYKTPDYMLSTAQDYRKGYGGDQQHIWQATLGADAVCFTTHPAKLEGVTPNYWAGSGLLPRAAQYKNVAIVIYNIEKIPALYVPIRHFFTHAWFPKDKFDQVVERNGWIFARKGDGYLGLFSQNPYYWKEESQALGRISPEDAGREILVPGKKNIWICQMGRKAEDGEFNHFVEKTAAAAVKFNGLEVEFQSPTCGLIRFGWKQDLSVEKVFPSLDEYPRYANPFVQAEFNPAEIEVNAGGDELRINWITGSE
jgi:hypothetical protein